MCDSDAAVLDSCLVMAQGCHRRTGGETQAVKGKGCGAASVCHLKRLDDESEREPLRKMESHAHKETTRAIVSIGAGHGNNVIKSVWGCACRALCGRPCAALLSQQKNMTLYSKI